MDPIDPNAPSANSSYALSGKIMLSAIVILFFVVILMVCLHLYARWYLLRARRRHSRRVRNRRTHMVFYVDHDNPNNPANVGVPARGLDSAVLKTLPLFVFDPKSSPEPIECAVCLSEFEENETGRVLPKCNHSFHLECIDMWFHSHSTCPLCRSPVEPVENPTTGSDSGSETVHEVETELCDTCRHEIGGASTSWKPVELVGITIEVPSRPGGFGDELSESPASQSFRSPMSRMLSFTRILSRDRRACLSPTSCELDIESNRQTQSGGVGGIEN